MKFLLRDDLRDRGIRWTNKHLLSMERAGKFPRRTYLGERTPAWLEAEIEKFQAERLAKRDAA